MSKEEEKTLDMSQDLKINCIVGGIVKMYGLHQFGNFIKKTQNLFQNGKCDLNVLFEYFQQIDQLANFIEDNRNMFENEKYNLDEILEYFHNQGSRDFFNNMVHKHKEHYDELLQSFIEIYNKLNNNEKKEFIINLCCHKNTCKCQECKHFNKSEAAIECQSYSTNKKYKLFRKIIEIIMEIDSDLAPIINFFNHDDLKTEFDIFENYSLNIPAINYKMKDYRLMIDQNCYDANKTRFKTFANNIIKYVMESIDINSTNFKEFLASYVVNVFLTITLFGSGAYNLKLADDLDFAGEYDIICGIIKCLNSFFEISETEKCRQMLSIGKNQHLFFSKQYQFVKIYVSIFDNFLTKIDFVPQYFYAKMPPPDFYECTIEKKYDGLHIRHFNGIEQNLTLEQILHNLEHMKLTRIPMKITNVSDVRQMLKFHERLIRRLRNGYTINEKINEKQFIMLHGSDDKFLIDHFGKFIIVNIDEKCKLCSKQLTSKKERPFVLRKVEEIESVPIESFYHTDCIEEYITSIRNSDRWNKNEDKLMREKTLSFLYADHNAQ